MSLTFSLQHFHDSLLVCSTGSAGLSRRTFAAPILDLIFRLRMRGDQIIAFLLCGRLSKDQGRLKKVDISLMYQEYRTRMPPAVMTNRQHRQTNQSYRSSLRDNLRRDFYVRNALLLLVLRKQVPRGGTLAEALQELP
jgi:hypothetical protein